ncbi:MAG: 4Fe-4S dicluster domain-containing protein [Chloroflexi bacterium]|nr:4Fe-4S dicluster domain-containing protein [Chloroflexota bacterium]
MTAAYDLARKGYRVVILEAGDRLGGNLWKTSREELPADVILADVENVTRLGVEVRYDTPVNRLGLNGRSPKLAALRAEFDAVFLAFGAHTDDSFEVERDSQGKIKIDPVTLATSLEGVYAGGGLLWSIDFRSAITSISDGRRAGISIDRYLQRVSQTASRINEGPYVTRLYTDAHARPPAPMVEMDDPVDGYERHEAIEEAQRCLLCECMECVKVCEYLRRYERYPRKYVREIYNNLSIVKGTRLANQFINSCSLCGLCAEVCPEDLDMGAVARDARVEMVRQNRMPASAHDFALRDMEFSNGAHFALTRHAPGAAASEYVFFPGCQLSASSPEHVERVYADLRARLDSRVGLMLGCCGAPAEWAGRVDLFHSTLDD